MKSLPSISMALYVIEAMRAVKGATLMVSRAMPTRGVAILVAPEVFNKVSELTRPAGGNDVRT